MTGVTKQDAERRREKQMQAERMHDVLLLLQNLSNDQEATIKLIIDCLYEAGAVNLINQKIRFRPLNRMTKSVARVSKPVFRTVAWYWFQRNCPQLIVNWLLTKITFQPKRIAVALAENKPEALVEQEPRSIHQDETRDVNRDFNRDLNWDFNRVATLDRENRQLRHQVRLLTGVSAIAIVALGIVIALPHRTLEIFPTQKQRSASSANAIDSNQVTVESACFNYTPLASAISPRRYSSRAKSVHMPCPQ